MTESQLSHMLSRAAQALAAAAAPDAILDEVLSAIDRELGTAAVVERGQDGVTVSWKDAGDDAARAHFAATLAALATLAECSQNRGAATILDSQGFATAVDRVAAAARWRGARMAVSVFEVEGMVLGPGVDQSWLVEHVGKAALSSLRQDDTVGHLGASQFALLFPRAGTFEARSAFRRVREAVLRIEHDRDGLICGAVGFADLEPGQTGAELLGEARARMAAARLRNAYLSPGGGSPTQPLAS